MIKVFLCALVSLSLVSCSAADSSRQSGTATSQQASSLTQTKFESLHEGMSLVEVEKVLGRPGRQFRDSSATGRRSTAYEWTGRLGFWIHVFFLDDKLVDKKHGLLDKD